MVFIMLETAQRKLPPEIDFSAAKPFNQLVDCHRQSADLLWRDEPYNISVYLCTCICVYIFLRPLYFSLYLYFYFCIHVYV